MKLSTLKGYDLALTLGLYPLTTLEPATQTAGCNFAIDNCWGSGSHGAACHLAQD